MRPQPCVQSIESTRVSHHRSTGSTRPSLRNGFNGLLRALPGDRAFLSPSLAAMRSIVANLTSASGYQDHTTSPSASTPSLVVATSRPSHPAPNVRDDREAPLLRVRGMAGISNAVSSNRRSEIFLSEGLDTSEEWRVARTDLPGRGKSGEAEPRRSPFWDQIRCKTLSATDNAERELTNSDRSPTSALVRMTDSGRTSR